MRRLLPTPDGLDAATEFYREQDNKAKLQLPFRDTHQVKVQRSTTGQYLRLSIPSGHQSSSKRWQTPKKELDPSKAVAKGTWIYLSPENDLVATGLIDLITGMVVKAQSGIWEAAKTVPATVAGKYNVPQLPYPGATGTPSGSPLAGDLDGDDVFWIMISQSPVCI